MQCFAHVAGALIGRISDALWPLLKGPTYATWSGLFRLADAALECVGSYSLGKTVSSESSIFRFPLSAYPVLELALPGQGPWGVSSPGAGPGTPFSGPARKGLGGRVEMYPGSCEAVSPVYIICPNPDLDNICIL